MTIKIEALVLILLLIAVSRPVMSSLDACSLRTSQTNTQTDVALDLIRRQRYDDAVTALEKILESSPSNGEALTFLATANLYRNLDFTKAKRDFDEAFKAGGGATFYVSHSHESFSSDDEIVDYCRGWLHLRKDGVEFVPSEGTHGFKLRYDQISDFKQNRFSKKLFHIKVGDKNQNFRGRSSSELEPLLIIAVYRSFSSVNR